MAPVVLAVLVLSPSAAFAQLPPASEPPAASLPTVVVTGSRSERDPAEVPAVIDVLDREALDPAGVQDIRDLVQTLPNVSVKRAPTRFGAAVGSTGRDGNAGFNIRGLEGNRVLLTVDGVRMPRELTSGVFGSAAFGRDHFELGHIARVEIQRGAGSALYGSDGLAGHVAMFTAEPRDLVKPGQTVLTRLSLQADTEDDGRRVGLMVAGAPNERHQYLASLHAGAAGALDNQGRNTSAGSARTAPNPQDDRSLGALLKWIATPGGGQKHSFTAEHVDKRSEVEAYSGRGAANGFLTTDLDGTTDMRRSRLGWDGRFHMDAPWADELRATLALQDAESRELALEQRSSLAGGPVTGRSRDVTYEERLLQTTLQGEKTLSSKAGGWSQRLVYGVDLVRSELDNLVTGTVPPVYERYPLKRFPKTTENTVGAFVQNEFQTERWTVVPALRYDHVSLDAEDDALYPKQPADLSASALSPKLGAIYRVSDRWALFGNVAAGFRAPSALQLNNSFDNPLGYYQSIPNPDLKPEKSRTLELGARGGHEDFQWEASAFSGRYRDFIEELVRVGGTGVPGDPIRYQAVNRGQVRLSGAEIKGRWQLAAATALRLALGRTQGKDTSTGRPLNSVNPAELHAALEQKLGAWTVGLGLTHVAAKKAKDVDFSATPAQFVPKATTTLDLKTSWQLSPATRLSAAVRNLTDRTYWQWTNVRGVAATSPVLDAYTAPGRSVSVALVTNF
ncbi:TonB-dependent hemoglobin/transferrin/lactoferrin family receptor [Hydrogenophaga pseudoflava]|uniref:TonB-dependent hemoglobin/transferrin/lactoferrin family receptor n=1 Tax=Hydrogenophaga pseudoflava TaxID=47421 RepID=UPI0027E52C14|nr:TonB-dependent hemoglobin/transferrin/lactoferrin family receptor [Hydrogenophaga pseudoflava]MDQ7746951.1 TonB-dependent hemoglobin/transferrin/lactoferrin family receptor [Hydrogenophaga pseudoflava]